MQSIEVKRINPLKYYLLYAQALAFLPFLAYVAVTTF
jgi:hypothetical protein